MLPSCPHTPLAHGAIITVDLQMVRSGVLSWSWHPGHLSTFLESFFFQPSVFVPAVWCWPPFPLARDKVTYRADLYLCFSVPSCLVFFLVWQCLEFGIWCWTGANSDPHSVSSLLYDLSSTIYWKDFLSLFNYLGIFVKSQLAMYMCIYLWTFYSVFDLYVYIPMPFSLDYCSFLVSLEVRECMSSNFVLLFQSCLTILGHSAFPYKF